MEALADILNDGVPTDASVAAILDAINPFPHHIRLL